MPPRASAAKEIFIVTGMSGAGKSQALKALEDLGYFCVDNLPVVLMDDFVRYLNKLKRAKVALGLDIREKNFLHGLSKSLSAVKRGGYRAKIVFLDANARSLVRRFSETRRRHPLGRAVDSAVSEERRLLRPVARLASYRIDTSGSSLRDLKTRLAQIAGVKLKETLQVRVMSFGFKHGSPSDVDILMDVRFLPNPYWKPELRDKTGLDRKVKSYLKKRPEVRRFLNDFAGLLKKLLPAYAREGKAYLTVAVGCTGGQHRSVFLSSELGRRLRAEVFHRDIQKRW